MAPLRWMIIAAAVAALVACGNDGAAPTSPPTLPPPTTSTSTPTTPTPTTPNPTVDLADHLATPADLGPEWSIWEGFIEWPGAIPGAIPDEQRSLIPALPLCAAAGDAVPVADDLRWEVFTQLHRETEDPFANMVVVQQLLMRQEPDVAATTFATLREGLTSCLTANLPAGDWEIGLREALEIPAVGDERHAERSSSVEPGGVRRDTRWVLVREDDVLMVVQLDDILLTPDAEPALTSADVDDVVVTLAGLLP